ncbi:hypothetical protein EDC96DRAFT_576934 [Choanephora cucurbitarum]|nr:hypothetical protein EDC96DRAFT_576934 [Choanephora cucurbitarum]
MRGKVFRAVWLPGGLASQRIEEDRERDRQAYEARRANPDHREPERERDKLAHQEQRSSSDFRHIEQGHDTERRREARLAPNFETLAYQFKREVTLGPTSNSSALDNENSSNPGELDHELEDLQDNILTNGDVKAIEHGDQETMIISENEGIRMAPAEGIVPMSVLLDKDLDFLAFPTIYNGEKLDILRQQTIKLQRILKICCTKNQLETMVSNINIFSKKHKHNGRPINAGYLLQRNTIDIMLNRDEAYKVFSGIRSSSEDWRAAEAHWPELLRTLAQVIDSTHLTLEEAADLPYEAKARLIQADPIT